MIFTQEHQPHWKLSSRLSFRFIFLFLVVFIIMMPARYLLSPVLVWIGENIFETSGRLELESTGSGDDTMAWLSLFLQFAVAIVGFIIWSVLDRRRSSYNDLFYWFRTILRVFVSFFMILYGFAKVFLVQFNEPSLLDLLQPFGDMSPMGLAWAYMGYSPAFEVFTGLLEVIAGFLLISKRTQTLGALFVVGIMTHVAVMNLCFDIPVKIFSIHLALMGLVLLLSDIKRFQYVFFRKHNIKLSTDYRPINPRFNKAIRVFKICSLSFIILGAIALRGLIYLEQRKDQIRDEFYGIWEVETFIKNGDTIPPLTTIDDRWRYMIMETKGSTVVKKMNDSIDFYYFKVDSIKNSISIYKEDNTEAANNFYIEQKDSLHLKIKGLLDQDSLKIHLKAIDLKDFTLINRGFHWVNETPYNK
ncbi:DoxX family protein [Nonlabens dokdonensis]|uniref:DoxX family protein n=1 Tax=Nonlabens dokdonensis TaxID=328515 RepID=UPI0026E9D034|nr:DoxX family protein [Nonlabens dokdonensis]